MKMRRTLPWILIYLFSYCLIMEIALMCLAPDEVVRHKINATELEILENASTRHIEELNAQAIELPAFYYADRMVH